MPGHHPEALDPAEQVARQMRTLAGRVRALEARLNDLPLLVIPATPVGTGLSTPAPLWTLLDVSPTLWTIRITLLCALSTTANAGLLLFDQNGARLDQADVADGSTVTLTATGATGPFTVSGYTSAGTLSTTVVSSSATPWLASDA